MTFVLADSVWWGGRLSTGVALRMADRVVVPVAEVPAGAVRQRVPGTVLGGLRDAHVHSDLVDLWTVRSGGVGVVWDLGGVPEKVFDLARRGREAGSRLPQVRAAGPFLIAPGGYPSDRAWAAPGSWREVRDVGDADTAVGEAVAAGATLIKVTAHAGGPMLSAKVMAAVVSAAHAARAASPQTHFRNSGFGAGVPVVVHAEGPGTVAAALDAGADLLAHTPWTEEVDDGLIRASAASMTWISTLDIHGWGEETPARIRAVANLRAFHGYGGNVLYGTDLGNGPLPPAINAREIRALQSAGLTPAEVLAAMIDTDGEPGWIAGGLDLDPARFSDVMATARVLGPEVRPRS